MSSIGLAFVSANAVALLSLPRRLALLPLLIGACYMTRAQAVDVGPFTFTVVRLLIAVGLVRACLRGERLEGGITRLDWLMVSWGAWMVMSGVFHDDVSAALVTRLGLVYDAWGLYVLVRIFCRSWADIAAVCRFTAMVMVPIAVAMLWEKATGTNAFSLFGGVAEVSRVREGQIRAQGPFAHAILGGTIGAVALPLVVGLWKAHRGTVIVGVASCLSVIYASSSSGPVMTGLAAVGALLVWRYRSHLRLARWGAVMAYAVLALLMNSPPYYLMARIDVAGGSTGWHRARLIEAALSRIDEWWLAGTNYTRHWMPTGVSWSPDHTDITNHYLQLGVVGGVPAMLLFIAVLAGGFVVVGRGMQRWESPDRQFLLWAAGAALFAHAVTCVAVAYFDQSNVFLYMTLGLIGSAGSMLGPGSVEKRLQRRGVLTSVSSTTAGAWRHAASPGRVRSVRTESPEQSKAMTARVGGRQP